MISPPSPSRYILATIITLSIIGPLAAHPPFDAIQQKHLAEVSDPRPVDILYEDFEGPWLPDDWARIITEPLFTWDQTEIRSHSGQFSTWVEYSPQGLALDEWLVTPAMDFNGYPRVYLEFFEDQHYWGGFGGTHSILVSTSSQTDPSAFTNLVVWTPENHTINGFNGEPVFLDLSDYLGESTVYLAFRYEGTWADNWFIDDVRVFYPDENDAAALKAFPDQVQFEGGDIIHPEAVVINLSGEAFTFDVSMEVEESGSSIYYEQVSVTLEPAARDTLEFPQLLLNSGNYYKLFATTLLEDDQVPENDQVVGFIDTYTQDHLPLGWLHTNAGSGPSAPADILMDAIMEEHPRDIALVRLHTWWPGYDEMYEANIPQSDSLLAFYGVDYVPHFWVDGNVDARFMVNDYESRILDRRRLRSPQNINMIWNEEGYLSTQITNIDPLDPDGIYRLITIVTEDSILFSGGNGILYHNQAFRQAFPSLLGVDIPAEVGVHEVETPIEFDPGWNTDQLRITCFVQDAISRRIWQTASGLLGELRPQFYFDPSVSVVGQTGTLAIPIIIHPGLQPVMGMEVIVDFDPSIVELLEVNPGDWFTDSGHPYYFYDYTPDEGPPAGSIHFAAALLNASGTKVDTVAVCEFRGLNLGGTALNFVDVDVRDPINTFLSYGFSLEDSIIVDDTATSVEVGPPGAYRLYPCRPNPFNPHTSISFDLPVRNHVRLRIYDIQGRSTATLIDETLPAGSHAVSWDGRNQSGVPLASGVYFYRIETGDFVKTERMVLLK